MAAHTTPPLSMLLVEDDASDAWLLQNTLETLCPGEFKVTHANSLEQALPQLADTGFDIALLDLSLPGTSELEALQTIRHAAPMVPVIILTGYDDESLALTAMKHGAQDYLVKERTEGQLIKRAVRYAIERKHFEDNLTLLANYDSLTGLVNRALFISRLEMALARIRRSGEQVAVYFIDLNKFKQANDRLGHDAGDALLKEVANRLGNTLRECDTVARLGGDEFALLLEGKVAPRDCAIVAQKVIDTLAQPFALAVGEASLGASIGIAIAQVESTPEELLQHADAAMYRAKKQGRSNYQFYTRRMHEETIERLQLEHEIAIAITKKHSLCLHYQPKLELASGCLAGAEALIRWNHPERGMLSPAEFLPLLQPSMAAELDLWVLETVCRDIQCWQAAGLKPVQISVHLSHRQWENPKGLHELTDILAAAGLHTQCIAVEIEEMAMLHYDSDGFGVLSRMRETGIELHLDNFGVDVSSLKVLTRCPLAAMKIDRHLTNAMNQHEQQAILVKSLIELGHRLGMKIVAEGVETEEQLAMLTHLRCDVAQGHVISRPLPASEFFNWMGNHAQAAIHAS